MNKAVFLDRDGTINVDMGYLSDPGKLILYEDAIQGMQRLVEWEFILIVISNQCGIGEGVLSAYSVGLVNQKMFFDLSELGIKLSGIYYCSHKKEEKCICRKPNIGMLLQGKKDFDLDFGECFMMGNKDSDISAGQNAGIKSVLIERPGCDPTKVEPDFITDSLDEGAKWITRRASNE